MKKKLLMMLLALAMVMSPAAVFADDAADGGEGSQQDAAAAAEAEEPAVDAVALAEESAEKAAEQLAALSAEAEEQAAPAEEGAQDELNAAEDVSAQDNSSWTDGWNADRTQFKENGQIVAGRLFKAQTKGSAIYGLYYADTDGYVVRSTKVVTVTQGTLYYYKTGQNDGWESINDSSVTSLSYLVYNDGSDYSIKTKFNSIEEIQKTPYYIRTEGTDGSCIGGTVRVNAGLQKIAALNVTVYIKEGGLIQSEAGLVTDAGLTYYVQQGGIVKLDAGFITYNGKLWFVNAGGTVRTTAGFFTYNGYTFYSQADGSVVIDDGFIDVGGARYYVGSGGAVRTAAGTFTYAGSWYLTQAGGVVRTAAGFFTQSGVLYYVQDGNGVLAVSREFKIGKKKYHALADATIARGAHKWGKYYYFSDGNGVVRTKKGFVKYNGKNHYVQSGGKLALNKKFKYKGKYYISGPDGVFYTGFFKWKKALYYASSKGVLRTKAGSFKVGLYRYYSRKGGKLYTNKTFKAGGKTYRAYSDGHLATGVYVWNNKYYYSYDSGAMMTKEALFTWNGKSYYNAKGGGLKTSSFVKSDGKFYYVGSSAYVLKSKFTYKGYTIIPNSSTGEIDASIYYQLFPSEAE